MPIISGGNVMPGDGLSNDFYGDGAPTVDVTQLGFAVVGSRYVDTTAGELYMCTATDGTSTITWTIVGTQT